MRKFGVRVVSAALALAVMAASSIAYAGNLVQNGNFGTGDLTGWSTTATGYWFVGSTSNNFSPYPGDSFYAGAGCVNYCQLSQTLSTTTGQTYSLSFAFNPGQQAVVGADTQVYWDGMQVADVGRGPVGWSTYTINGLLASSSSTPLVFNGINTCTTMD